MAMLPKTTFVCPYCFEKRKLSEVEFRCINQRCADHDDVPITIYESGDVSMPKKGKRTFLPPKGGGVPRSAQCPDCRQTTYKRVCPACHNELPESTLTGKDMIISVVGSRSTGKSHFVGVVIKELIERVSVAFGGSMEGFADSYARWDAGFYRHMYVDGTKLELTRSSLQNIDNNAYRPLIFKFKLRRKGLFKESIDSFTFVFFDTAGEDLNSQDTMSTVNKYICKSAGIIFLLDPMQIPYITGQLDRTVVERAGAIDHATQADDIMTRVSNLIRNDAGLSDSARIDIPVAAVFSKFDAVESLIPPGSKVLETSPHCALKRFDLPDWHNVNGEIKALLREWNEVAFSAQLETNYTKYSYFAVSALGMDNNPSAEGRIQRPRPHRIEDPLLWILKENGVIPAK